MFDREGRMIAACGANVGHLALCEFSSDGDVKVLMTLTAPVLTLLPETEQPNSANRDRCDEKNQPQGPPTKTA